MVTITLASVTLAVARVVTVTQALSVFIRRTLQAAHHRRYPPKVKGTGTRVRAAGLMLMTRWRWGVATVHWRWFHETRRVHGMGRRHARTGRRRGARRRHHGHGISWWEHVGGYAGANFGRRANRRARHRLPSLHVHR